MSYRIYVNDTQLFGNNESYPEWDDYVKSQGIEIGPEGGIRRRSHGLHVHAGSDGTNRHAA